MEINATDFIFHSDLVPLSFPFKTGTSIETGTSLAAGENRVTYGPWFETGPGSLGVNSFITIGGRTSPDFIQERLLKAPGSHPRLSVWVEKDSTNRVRVAMREHNQDTIAHTYTKVTILVDFYMVHIV